MELCAGASLQVTVLSLPVFRVQPHANTLAAHLAHWFRALWKRICLWLVCIPCLSLVLLNTIQGSLLLMYHAISTAPHRAPRTHENRSHAHSLSFCLGGHWWLLSLGAPLPRVFLSSRPVPRCGRGTGCSRAYVQLHVPGSFQSVCVNSHRHRQCVKDMSFCLTF